MGSLKFVYQALVRVYMEAMYHPPRLCHEVMHESIMCDSFQYDGNEEKEFILENTDWTEEGYFTVWMTGHFVWTTDYWGETDMDVELDSEEIVPASTADLEAVTGFQCYTDPKSLFSFNKDIT